MPLLDQNQAGDFQDVFSYATLEYADEYLGTKLSTKAVWTSLSTEDKEAALREATLDMDTQTYSGRKLYVAQEREFPRFLDQGSIGDVFYLQDLILPDIANACCEQAWWIAKTYVEGHDHRERQEHQFQGANSIQRVGAGESYDLSRARRHSLCRKAYQLLVPYIAKTGNLRDAYDPNANRRTTY